MLSIRHGGRGTLVMAGLAWCLASTGRAAEPAAGASEGVSANRGAATAVPAAVDPAGAPGPAGASASAGEARAIPRPADRTIRNPRAGNSGGDANAPGHSAGWRSWSKNLLPLAIVVGLIVACAALVRRLAPARWRGAMTGPGAIQILARQLLTSKESVVLLKVGRRVVLVGVSAGRVSPIDTITDPDEVAELVGRAASGKANSMTSVFQQQVLRQAATYEPIERAEDGASASAEEPAESDEGGCSAAYASAREQLRGVLQRVRSLTGAA